MAVKGSPAGQKSPGGHASRAQGRAEEVQASSRAVSAARASRQAPCAEQEGHARSQRVSSRPSSCRPLGLTDGPPMLDVPTRLCPNAQIGIESRFSVCSPACA